MTFINIWSPLFVLLFDANIAPLWNLGTWWWYAT